MAKAERSAAPSMLRPYLTEISLGFAFGYQDDEAIVEQAAQFAGGLLQWLAAHAEGAAVHECRPRHDQAPGAFGFRRIVPVSADTRLRRSDGAPKVTPQPPLTDDRPGARRDKPGCETRRAWVASYEGRCK